MGRINLQIASLSFLTSPYKKTNDELKSRASEWVLERVAKSFITSLFLVKALAASHTKANYCFYVMLFWFIFPVWKTDGSFGQPAKARATLQHEREPAPAGEQRRQEPYIFLIFFWVLFWGGNGNFPCRRSLLPKNCCSPGVVERKRCPTTRFWSGRAPADRDVWLFSPGHLWCYPCLDKTESDCFTMAAVFRK